VGAAGELQHLGVLREQALHVAAVQRGQGVQRGAGLGRQARIVLRRKRFFAEAAPAAGRRAEQGVATFVVAQQRGRGGGVGHPHHGAAMRLLGGRDGLAAFVAAGLHVHPSRAERIGQGLLALLQEAGIQLGKGGLALGQPRGADGGFAPIGPGLHGGRLGCGRGRGGAGGGGNTAGACTAGSPRVSSSVRSGCAGGCSKAM
jgi:hypothetical protein